MPVDDCITLSVDRLNTPRGRNADAIKQTEAEETTNTCEEASDLDVNHIVITAYGTIQSGVVIFFFQGS